MRLADERTDPYLSLWAILWTMPGDVVFHEEFAVNNAVHRPAVPSMRAACRCSGDLALKRGDAVGDGRDRIGREDKKGTVLSKSSLYHIATIVSDGKIGQQPGVSTV